MISCQSSLEIPTHQPKQSLEKEEQPWEVVIDIPDYFPFEDYEQNPSLYFNEDEITDEMMDEWVKFVEEEETHFQRAHNPPPGFIHSPEKIETKKTHIDSPYPTRRRRTVSDGDVWKNPERNNKLRRYSFADTRSTVESLEKDLYLFLLDHLKGKEREEFLERIRNIRKATKMLEDEQARRIQVNRKAIMQEELQRTVKRREALKAMDGEKKLRLEQDYLEDLIFLQHHQEPNRKSLENDLMYQHFMGRTISS